METKPLDKNQELHELFLVVNQLAMKSGNSVTTVLNALQLVHEQLLIREIRECRNKDQKANISPKYTVN
jgi:hypothetical protein